MLKVLHARNLVGSGMRCKFSHQYSGLWDYVLELLNQHFWFLLRQADNRLLLYLLQLRLGFLEYLSDRLGDSFCALIISGYRFAQTLNLGCKSVDQLHHVYFEFRPALAKSVERFQLKVLLLEQSVNFFL